MTRRVTRKTARKRRNPLKNAANVIGVAIGFTVVVVLLSARPATPQPS